MAAITEAQLMRVLRKLRAHSIAQPGAAECIAALAVIRDPRFEGLEQTHAALASLLATNKEQWCRIRALLQLEACQPSQRSAVEPEAVDVSADEGPPPPLAPRWWLRPLLPIWQWLRRAPAWLLVTWLVAVLGLLTAAIVAPLVTTPPPLTSEATEAPSGPAPDETLSWSLESAPLIPERTVPIRQPVTARELAAGDWALLAFGLGLLALGLRWILLPRVVLPQRQKTLAHRQSQARAARREFSEAWERLGHTAHLDYQVERFAPLGEDAIEDSAAILGRLFRELEGRQLDAERTIARSVAAGGRVVPVHQSRKLAHGLLVLVDLERGDHPWLKDVGWVLARWRELGVDFERYDFRADPGFLYRERTRQPLTLAELARRADGEPLLIASRLLATRDPEELRDLVRRLQAWPLRAWLDPDPRPLPERRAERRGLRLLAAGGLERFPLSAKGLRTLARSLVEPGQSPGAPELDALRPVSDPGLREALEHWAFLASLVPDATWDQLELIRRRFPEVSTQATDYRYLQRLLEWVRQQTESDQGPPESGDGRTLELSDALVERLLSTQRKADAHLPEEQRLEARGRRLLLEQLDPTRPDDPILLKEWHFKRALHVLSLSPERAKALIAPLLGGAHDAELRGAIQLELDRRAADPSFDPATRDALALAVGYAGSTLAPSNLLARPWQAWAWPLLAVMACVLVGWATARVSSGILQEWWLTPPGEELHGRAVLPAVHAVTLATKEFRDTLADGSPGPLMVRLPGGRYQMGSPDGETGRYENEERHWVDVEPFAIGKYEVTFDQYQRYCQAVESCTPPDDEGWGRGRRPVINVSWHDATAYADWLARETGKPYRLATEAEWEYAARGGTASARHWGDDAGHACTYANVLDETGAKTELLAEYANQFGMHTCDDTAPYTAAVGSYTPNGYGLHDMLGNVWEWTCSQYEGSYTGTETRCSAVESNAPRVLRGGSFDDGPRNVRSDFRFYSQPDGRLSLLGFRLAQD